MPTALFSVYDKEDVVDFARALVALNWDIIASAGTAKALEDGNVPVRNVADFVGGGPILGHRVVTLSREIHAGLLARENDREELKTLGIPWIDMVVVDLYPLQETIDMPGTTLELVLESTDIGGRALLLSAAKGERIAVCDKEDWAAVAYWLQIGGLRLSGEYNFAEILAAKAERVVAEYGLAGAAYRSYGKYAHSIGRKWAECSGENPRQSPAVAYRVHDDDPLSLDKFEVIEGSAPSFTNWRDVDRLLQTVTHIAAVEKENIGHVSNIAVAVKHGNPCGAALASTCEEALEDMIYGDTRAIFGATVMTNFPITPNLAALMARQDGTDKKRLFDGIVAPDFASDAIDLLKRKNGRCRFYKNQGLYGVRDESIDHRPIDIPVRGGFLRQQNYTYILRESHIQLVSSHGTRWNYLDAYLAWAIGSTSNSNTVTLVRDGMLIGNGVGQQDRVGACELAIKRADDAGHSIDGATAYSDGFFPFNDGPEALIVAGVRTIIAPSGSLNDERFKELCLEQDVVLLLIPARGFFGH